MILSEILSYNHAGGIWFRIIPKHFLQRTNLRIFPRYPTSVQQSREQIEPFRSRDNLSKHPREQNKPFRSRDNLGRHPREQNKPFRSRDNLSRHPREQNKPFRSRDNLSKHHREQNKPFRSRDNLGRHHREQNKPFRSRDNLGRHPREHLELSLRTGKAGWSAFFGTRPHIGRKNGHRTAELFLL